MINRAQCLLLLESGGQPSTRSTRRSSNSSAKVFALLPRVFKDTCPEIFSFFEKHNVQIVDSSCKLETYFQSPVNSTKLDVLEFEVQLTSNNFRSNDKKLLLKIFKADKKFARIGFSGSFNQIRFITQFKEFKYFSAFYEENTVFFESCLAQSVEFSYLNLNGFPFSHVALREGSLAVVKYLLNSGCVVDVASSNGWTPLHIAAELGCLKIVKKLVKLGADVNAQGNTERKNNDSLFSTPLLLAVMSGSLKVVKFLLDAGADINFVNHMGCDENSNRHDVTPLHLAAKEGHSQVVHLLTQRAAKIDVNAESLILKCPSPLMIAAKNGHLKVVKLLLDRGADVHGMHHVESSVGRTALHFAAENGHLETVKTLLSEGASIDAKSKKGLTPLLVASKRGHVEVTKFLLDAGADINAFYLSTSSRRPKVKKETNLLTVALRSRNEELLELILPRLKQVSTETLTKFYHYMTGSCEEITDCLSTLPFTLESENLQNVDKTQLLFGAITKGRLDTVEQLLTNGVSVNSMYTPCKSEFPRMTPLHWAVIIAEEVMVKFLLSHGAEVNALDEEGRNPAFHAISNDRSDILKLLIRSKVNTRHADLFADAALLADDWAELLLQNGADPDSVKNKFQLISVAVFRGRCQLLKLLLKFGANIRFREDFILERGGIPHMDMTMLVMAVTYDQFECFQILLDFSFHDVKAVSYMVDFVVFNVPQKYRTELGHSIVKMLTAGVPISCEHVEYLLGGTAEDFETSCMIEISMLVNETFEGTDLNLCDVLMSDVERVVAYARNASVVEYFRTGDYKNKFPIYASIIEWQFEKGCHRRDSLDFGIRVFSSLFKHFVGLPAELKEKIVGLLDNLELQLLRCL